MVTCEPRNETIWPQKSSRKSRWRSGVRSTVARRSQSGTLVDEVHEQWIHDLWSRTWLVRPDKIVQSADLVAKRVFAHVRAVLAPTGEDLVSGSIVDGGVAHVDH